MLNFQERPHERRHFLHKRLLRIGAGLVPGGGTALDILGGLGGRGSKAAAMAAKYTPAQLAGTLVHLAHGHSKSTAGHEWMTAQLIAQARASAAAAPAIGIAPSQEKWGRCQAGSIKVGDKCVSPGDLFPGGDPLLSDAGGIASVGGFGLPAFTPEQRQRVTRRCPARMVLGIDNLCYPKAVLPPRSLFRKWRRPPRPTLSRRDEVAIRRASKAKDRVLALAKEAGLHASKTKPKASSSSRKGHGHALAVPVQGGSLQVISETN